MRRPQLVSSEPVKDEDDVLIAEIKLKSGKFESRIEIPLHSPADAKKEFIEQWLALMAAGLKCQPPRKEGGGE